MKHIKLFEAFLNEGSGNKIIRFDGVNCPTYYIDYYEQDEDNPDGDPNETFLEDVIGNISHFTTVALDKLTKPERLSNDETIYFENDSIKVVFADNEWSMAVGCIPVLDYDDDGDETYDKQKFKEESTMFFIELLGAYNLRTATGAWTSEDVTEIKL